MCRPNLSMSVGRLDAVTSGLRLARGLNPLLVFVVALALVAIALSGSYLDMLALWDRTAHQHGIVVFPVVIWLIWRQAAALEHAAVRPALTAVVLLAANMVIWLLANLAGVQAVEHLAALLAVPLVFVALGGWRLAWRFKFALAFVLIALPISDLAVPMLMRLTADIAETLLALSGIPFFRRGQYLSLPGGEFVVAEVCSGVRYFTAGLITLLVFAHLSFASAWRQWALVTIGAVVLVFSNGLRAFIVMAVASATEMRWLSGADHIYFGWFLFGVVILAIMWIAGRYADLPVEAKQGGDPGESLGTGPGASGSVILALGAAMLVATLNPLQSGELQLAKLAFAAILVAAVIVYWWRKRAEVDTASKASATSMNGPRLALSLGLATLVLASARWAAGYAVAQETVESRDLLPELPATCSWRENWPLNWQPVLVNATDELIGTLDCAATENADVFVFAGRFTSALNGGELVSGGHRYWPKNASTRAVTQASGVAELANVNALQVDANTLVWQWYVVDSDTAASPWRAKHLQVQALLSGRPAGGTVLVMATRISAGDVDFAKRRLQRAATAWMEAFQ